MSGVDTFDDAKACGYYAGYGGYEREGHHDPQRYAWGMDDFEHQRNDAVHHVIRSPYAGELDIYSRMRLFFPPVIENIVQQHATYHPGTNTYSYHTNPEINDYIRSRFPMFVASYLATHDVDNPGFMDDQQNQKAVLRICDETIDRALVYGWVDMPFMGMLFEKNTESDMTIFTRYVKPPENPVEGNPPTFRNHSFFGKESGMHISRQDLRILSVVVAATVADKLLQYRIAPPTGLL